MREGWPWEIVHDDGLDLVIEVDRIEGYERAARKDIMSNAVKANWHKYSSLLRERSRSS